VTQKKSLRDDLIKAPLAWDHFRAREENLSLFKYFLDLPILTPNAMENVKNTIHL